MCTRVMSPALHHAYKACKIFLNRQLMNTKKWWLKQKVKHKSFLVK